ncbi:SMC-Scp complex subunit ScpB [Nocardioides bruguierae]|uniref:SMC-Scp complex subunit ScpB n=1 Tax=Nocardioides bruguierae TaxID=2945102 RepID=UPI00202299D3|nr:SMC-Scp complex subunit ScpB [Nocardioides bruguierae]MCL8026060.1 SMC-Scp complex subunit ScpB [Nocardioides bruguierae]
MSQDVSQDVSQDALPVTEQESRPGSEEAAPAVPASALRPALEAVLMVADQPLDAIGLASVLGHPVGDVVAALQLLAEEYTEQGRGFELRQVAGGWRFYTREDYAAVVEKFVLEGQQSRLTQAALETLAVVAYKQPVSRARVSAVRGVNVDGVMRTLLTRGLVEEAGTDPVSGAHLYRTSAYFLERIGILSLDELPELAPYLPDMEDLDEIESALASPGLPRRVSGEPGDTGDARADESPAGPATGETGDAQPDHGPDDQPDPEETA